MSELSDQIKQTLETLTNEEGGTSLANTITASSSQAALEGIPGSTNFQRYYGSRCLQEMRVFFHLRGGADPYDDAQVALDHSGEYLMPRFTRLLLSVLADGMQLGQGVSSSVKKYTFFKKLDEIPTDESFRADSALHVMSLEADEEVWEIFREYLEMTSVVIMAGSGLNKAVSAELNQYLWDMWMMSFASCATGALAVGYRMGKQHAETDVLSGILAATEAEEGDDG